MLSLAAFRSRTGTTFSSLSDEVVTTALEDAAADMDAAAWADLADRGHQLTTSAILARSSAGVQAKLVRDDGTTIYDKEFSRLRAIVGGSKGSL